jgi:hypothetical protein
MKSATTTLYRWLGSHEAVTLPDDKEPGFFARDDVWARGLAWYDELFAGIAADEVTGEASVVYTSPELAPVAAERIATALPAVQLICILRDPVDRMRSHYRHEVQRGREKRTFLDAVSADDSVYVSTSCYYECLAPYLVRFRPAQLLVLRMEELTVPPFAGWDLVLDHLMLKRTPPLGSSHNETAEKSGFSRLALNLWERGMLETLPQHMPRYLRRLGRRLLFVQSPRYEALIGSANVVPPNSVLDRVRESSQRLAAAIDLWRGSQRA